LLEIWVFLYQNGWTIICWATRNQGSRGFAAFNLLHTKTQWNTGAVVQCIFFDIRCFAEKKTRKIGDLILSNFYEDWNINPWTFMEMFDPELGKCRYHTWG
jgi:hypothetical protein